jgi:hypothetical protein
MTRSERRRVETLEAAHGGGHTCYQCGGDFDALHSYLLEGKLARYGGQVVSGVTAIKREGAVRGYAHNHCIGKPPTVYEISIVPNKAAPWARGHEKVKS